MAVNDHNLIWVDLEMTGLIPEQDRVIEIATIVTDTNLTILAEGPVIAIRQTPAVLAAMDEWNTRTHTRSGLVDRVVASTVSEDEAAAATVAFLSEWVGPGSRPCAAIRSAKIVVLWRVYLPNLNAFFHYRHLDVSTLKILAQRWRPDLPEAPKAGAHQALADIRESIEELRHYREHFLRV